MDAVTLTQQLAKQADTGTAAIILLLVVLCVVCWPHVVSGISRLRGKKTVTVEGDVHTAERQQYVTRGEFNAHVADNARDHENLFARLNANDKMTSKLDGILTTILSDLQDIKKRLWTIPTNT